MKIPPEALLATLKSNTPDPTKTMQDLRHDFMNLYLKYQKTGIVPEKVIVNNLECFWVAEKDISQPYVILFMHGGGFNMGSTRDHIGLCAKLSKYTCAKVFSVDYSLAPEHRFPQALNDCINAYQYLLDNGYESFQIIPVGISAGGTLVLSLLLALLDKKIKLPKLACCMSPAVSLLFPGQSILSNKNNDWITKERLDSIKNIYLTGQDPMLPLISPLYADLTNFPELFIQFGSHELMRDDILAFIHKAEKQDVPIKYEMWENMFHCWQIFSDVLPEGEQAIIALGNHIKKELARIAD